MVDNINKNTISEVLARKNLNTLNEIKKEKIKNKSLIFGQKELLNLFNNLFNAVSSENKNSIIIMVIIILILILILKLILILIIIRRMRVRVRV